MAVESASGEDRFSTPPGFPRDGVTGDSSKYSIREEVLAEPRMRLVVFPPAQGHKTYEVAKRKGMKEYIVLIKMKIKEKVKTDDRRGRRDISRCSRLASFDFSCPGVLDYPISASFKSSP